MAKALDIEGQVFGFLTIGPRVSLARKGSWWACTCICGTQKVVSGSELRKGRVRSCGCQTKALLSVAMTKHGMSRAPVYRTWAAMLSRCSNPRTPQYAHYGARGIYVCERWHTFENFVADMGLPPPGGSIERKDTNGPYTPENCCWATTAEQHKNRRNSRNVTFNGVTDTLAAHARRAGLRYDTAHYRIFRRGWSVHDALTTLPFGTRVGVPL
jgi:hypothetical protein